VQHRYREHADVLIVGGGFGGFYAARQLERSFHGHRHHHRVLLVAEENFFLFSPLLPEAASGTLEPRHAVIPLRSQLRSTEVVAGQVSEIDLDLRLAKVVDKAGQADEVLFRSLILAPGSVPSTLPIPGLAEEAVSFKTLADAIWLRNRVLAQLEAAEASHDPAARRALLTFTFVGGGYAGVEALAELESLAQVAAHHYHRVRPEDMRWVLVEGTHTLLPGISKRLALYTERQLRGRGIELHLSSRLASCVGGCVELDDGSPRYRSGTIVWTTGQRPSPLVASAGLPLDERGRVMVDDHLRVKGQADTYAVGDCAAVPDPAGGICPATAQHAMRQGALAGRNVAADHGVGEPIAFTYRTRGLAVTLGNGKGTAQVGPVTFTGPLAWWMGRSYHLLMMPGTARRARIVTDWTLGLLFPRDISQLGALGRPTPLPSPRPSVGTR
jgi:NADH dehydrogenase